MSSHNDYYGEFPFPPSTGFEAVSVDKDSIPLVNGHIHTPYSFSAFATIEQAIMMAREEGISVLGINDFNTTDGYPEFASLAKKYRVFPLFNIEFMALQKKEQQEGIRVNDPVNPGRTYLSGKGLRFPSAMGEESRKKLVAIQKESNQQTREMVDKLNTWLETAGTDLRFDADRIMQTLAKGLLRERHIATALRMAIEKKCLDNREQADLLKRIFGGRELKSSLSDIAGVENEIRGNLLKSGGPAYVPEDEKAFMSLEEVISLVTDAGGIPCYPVLLDDPKGNFTDFEKDWPRMAEDLIHKGIAMVELIPGRNDSKILSGFVQFFRSKGFVITLGTEHNTPLRDPLTVTSRGGIAPDEVLLRINYEGAAVIAAHQVLTAEGKKGFPAGRMPSAKEVSQLAAFGHGVISQFIHS